MRKLLLIPALVFALSAGFSSPARATAPTEYMVTYADVSSVTTSVRQADGNTFTTAVDQAVLMGDIVGSATETDYFTAHADGSANFTGMFTCACTVADRSGTLTVRFTGKSFADGTLEGQDVVVGGTLGLATLHGQGTFQGCGDAVCKDLLLHFDP